MITPTPSWHVDPRNEYLSPRYVVARIGSDTEDAWKQVAPVPLLTDLYGEDAPADVARVRLAYDDQALYLAAEDHAAPLTVLPDVPPDDLDHFWMQDHIEFRLLPDPQEPLNQIQFIVTPDGRVFDSLGLWKQPDALHIRTRTRPVGWAFTVRLPFAELGLPAPAEGSRLFGLIAHGQWREHRPHLSCISATQLGFTQAERFAEFVFEEDSPCPVRLAKLSVPSRSLQRGDNDVVVRLSAIGPFERGRLLVNRESGASWAGETRAFPISRTDFKEAPDGGMEAELHMPLAMMRPRYTRYRFSFETHDHVRDLGAVSLRAAVAPIDIDTDSLKHPYLFFDDGELRLLRDKATRAPIPALAQRLLAEQPADDDIPDLDSEISLAITPRSVVWFRVAKETMVRDGEGNRKPSARHLWLLQSQEAHAAWHGVVTSVKPTQEQLDVLTSELNRILSLPDFYQPEAFADIDLPDETRELLERGVDRLSDRELFRLNRIIFQNAVECVPKFRADLPALPGTYYALWLISGDRHLIDMATKAVRAALKFTLVGPYTDLHEGGASSVLAMAYDAFYPHLSEVERADWVRLLTRFLELHLHTARRHHWNCTAVPNANPVCNSGGGLLALALLKERREEATESLQLARRLINNWLDFCSGQDGGNTEGAQYWQYGTENFLRFAIALERVLGHDDGLLSHPGIHRAMNMIRVGISNDGNMHGVNDTIPLPIGAPLAWFLAGRFNDRFALWYGDHAERTYCKRVATGKPTPYRPAAVEALLYRPDLPEQTEQPPLPTAFALPDIQYGVIRSGEAYDCRLVAFLKGSRPPYTHHNQPDTGAYSIDIRGERMLIDPGYYKDEARYHSLPEINGRAPHQPQGFTGAITDCESIGDIRVLACDSTRAYRGAADRVVRTLVMVGDEGLVLLDDIVGAGGTPADVKALYQCGGPTTCAKGARGITIQGEACRVQLDVLTRPNLRLECHPERTLHDTHWGYHFADCRWFPVAGAYEADEQDPLVTVFLDVTERDGGAASVRRSNHSLSVTLPSGRTVRFVFFRGRWRVDTGRRTPPIP